MKILLMGPPGVGKGTQSKLICDFYKIEHVSTGNILRNHIKNSTYIGDVINEFHINNGDFVQDKLINDLMSEICVNYLCNKSYLLDGYPRTLNQSIFYVNKILTKSSKYLVIYLNADRKHILDRINHRWICSECGIVYNIKKNNSLISNICNKCGNKLIRRSDDKVDIFMKRLEIYDKLTKKAINYFNKFSVLFEVNASGDVNDVFNNIKDIIGEYYDLY